MKQQALSVGLPIGSLRAANQQRRHTHLALRAARRQGQGLRDQAGCALYEQRIDGKLAALEQFTRGGRVRPLGLRSEPQGDRADEIGNSDLDGPRLDITDEIERAGDEPVKLAERFLEVLDSLASLFLRRPVSEKLRPVEHAVDEVSGGVVDLPHQVMVGVTRAFGMDPQSVVPARHVCRRSTRDARGGAKQSQQKQILVKGQGIRVRSGPYKKERASQFRRCRPGPISPTVLSRAVHL